MDAREVLGILDLTLLDHDASESELEIFCNNANKHKPYSVCVFSKHVEFVRKRLDDGISIAAVVGGFPVGWQDKVTLRNALEGAVISGADEIDCVLEPRGTEDFPSEEDLALLSIMREGATGCKLKVIIEAPLLSEHSIRAVSRMALAAGADFVKSCTGRRGTCSDEHATILAMEVKRHQEVMGEERGLKLSGGIRVMDDVIRLMTIVRKQDEGIFGPLRIRIGASSLLDEIV